jgi:hypothetical protein
MRLTPELTGRADNLITTQVLRMKAALFAVGLNELLDGGFHCPFNAIDLLAI